MPAPTTTRLSIRKRLDRYALVAGQAVEPLAVEGLAERLGAQVSKAGITAAVALLPIDETKPPRIMIAQHVTAGRHEIYMIVFWSASPRRAIRRLPDMPRCHSSVALPLGVASGICKYLARRESSPTRARSVDRPDRQALAPAGAAGAPRTSVISCPSI